MTPSSSSRRPLQDANRLHSLGAAQASVEVVAFLNSVERSGRPADGDELLGVGVAVARARLPEVATAALDWLDAGVSEWRVDAAGLFLAGLWMPPAGRPGLLDGQVDRLLHAADRVRLGVDATRSLFVALYRAVQCGLQPPAWTQVTGRLLAMLADPVAGPPLSDLEQAVRRTLSTSTPSP